jgi:dolichol-phosphate mannosyltransferase
MSLWMVMPVYNEESAVADVIREWIGPVRATGEDLTFCIVDDGSRDKTPEVLDRLSTEIPELKIVHQKNAGHGPACLTGYHLAVDAGAEWIFQLDSDGQCDANYFGPLWAAHASSHLIFGRRVVRDDGFIRMIVSKIVVLVTFLATGRVFQDPNVPYRLMRGSELRKALPQIPCDFAFPNVALTWLLGRRESITWIPIRFRKRAGGESSVKIARFASHALTLFFGLRSIKKEAA